MFSSVNLKPFQLDIPLYRLFVLSPFQCLVLQWLYVHWFFVLLLRLPVQPSHHCVILSPLTRAVGQSALYPVPPTPSRFIALFFRHFVAFSCTVPPCRRYLVLVALRFVTPTLRIFTSACVFCFIVSVLNSSVALSDCYFISLSLRLFG